MFRCLCNNCLLSVSATSEDLPLLNFRWHIFPNINPDGHAYTHNVDRFWSKNRRQNKSGMNCTADLTDCCNGVNINRNFPSGFGFGPTDPCDRLIPFFRKLLSCVHFAIDLSSILQTSPILPSFCAQKSNAVHKTGLSFPCFRLVGVNWKIFKWTRTHV